MEPKMAVGRDLDCGEHTAFLSETTEITGRRGSHLPEYAGYFSCGILLRRKSRDWRRIFVWNIEICSGLSVCHQYTGIVGLHSGVWAAWIRRTVFSIKEWTFQGICLCGAASIYRKCVELYLVLLSAGYQHFSEYSV